MPILLPEDLNICLPEMITVRQKLNKEKLSDLKKEIAMELSADEIKGTVIPGQKIAVAVGSRGINRINEIVETVIKFLKGRGAEPFIVAAMGSHGGGTEKGRAEILSSYGIDETTMKVPVYTNPDVKRVGSTTDNIPIFMQERAYDADAIVLINRVKAHEDFTGPIESGLCKLAVIGLGSHIGCTALHKAEIEAFTSLIPEVAEIIFNRKNIIFGLAIIENATQETYAVKAIKGKDIIKKEPELLKIAKNVMPKLLIPEMDILIVEEIGKDIAGAGFDSNVIGRFGPKALQDDIPKYKQLVILGLSKGAHGNAIGIGYANITLKKVLDDIDFENTYGNCLACRDLECGYLPIMLDNEKEAICGAVKMLGTDEPEKCKIVRIKNTKDIEFIQVSKSLLPFVQDNPSYFEII